MEYYLSLGSNSGDRMANLSRALEELEAHGCRIVSVSRVYETEPWGYASQRTFYNLCARAICPLKPRYLLLIIKRIERMMGRLPAPPNTRRVIDIDIVLADIEVHTPELEIPHPRFKEREFVLVPLLEVLSEKHRLKLQIEPVEKAGRIISRLSGKIG